MSKLIPIFSIILFIFLSYALNLFPQADISSLRQTEQCFLDGQIPCRWTQDTLHPYGHFIYNQQGASLYHLGMIFRLLGFDYQPSITISLLLIFLLNIYLGFKLFKLSFNPNKAILLATLISITSYLLSLSLPILCLIIFFLFIPKNLYISTLAISSIILATPTSKLTLTIPILLAILLPHLFKNIKNCLLVIILSLALTAFYLGPSILENQYPKTPSSTINYISSPTTILGDSVISQYRSRSNFWRFTIFVNQNKPATVAVPMFYHPGWTILIDQNKITTQNLESFDLTTFSIPPGSHTVVAFLQDTQSVFTYNLVSLLTAIFIFIALFSKSVYKNY